jgi:hypothetical protein
LTKSRSWFSLVNIAVVDTRLRAFSTKSRSGGTSIWTRKNYRRRLGVGVIAKDLREEHDATGSDVTCAERVRSRRFEESSADLFGNRLLALKSQSGLCREGQAEKADP